MSLFSSLSFKKPSFSKRFQINFYFTVSLISAAILIILISYHSDNFAEKHFLQALPLMIIVLYCGWKYDKVKGRISD